MASSKTLCASMDNLAFVARCMFIIFLKLTIELQPKSCSVRGIKPEDLTSLKEKLEQEVCKYFVLAPISLSHLTMQ